MLPQPPASYTAVLDPPTFCTLSWVNGAGAVSVRHEVSIDGGATWARLDDDQVPTTTSDHSLPQPPSSSAGTNTLLVMLRAKSVNADGESAYTPTVSVTTTEYVP